VRPNPTRGLAIAALLAIACLGAASNTVDDGTAAPVGITAPPAGVTLATVLSAHKKAVGKIAAGTLKTRIETWTIAEAGQTGTDASVESGSDRRDDVTLGPVHTATGTVAGRDWHQNANGEVVIEHGLHHLDDISARALATMGKGVTLLGKVASPVAAYVIEAAPQGGRLEYLFYDKTTGQLIRREESIRGRRHVQTYDDFRTTKGLAQAWHIHASDGHAENDRDYRLQTLSLGSAVDPKQLAIPQSTTPVALASAKVIIPIKLIDDRVIIPVTISGRTVDFQLDSGASSILIDNLIVDALKLPTYGKAVGETAGTYNEGTTVVPLMTFGGVTMKNVVADSAPFTFWSDDKTPVAGLMGFDFIDGAVIHIDYERSVLEAYDASSFTPPAGATSIPIALDDDVPLVSTSVANVTGDRFIVDTGADRSTLFSRFVSEHSAQVADQGLGDEMVASYPFLTEVNGVGGTVKYRPLQAGPFAFGGHVFPKWLFQATHDAAAFEGDDFDGLVGQDVLRNFDVYLDYAHEKIWLVPNDRYNARWP
jgi:hypothetical protein